MIAQLTGTVLKAGATSCVLDVAGVGYLVHITAPTAAALRQGEITTLHTSLALRQDAITLFGFADEGEREAFELVQSASGVGPKLALAIVSVLTPAELRRAVQTEDLARLCSVPGVGRKGAQKLVIELKDKVIRLTDRDDPADLAVATVALELWRAQVSEGLQGLGWSVRDAEAACDNVAYLVEENAEIGIGQLLRAALNSLARK